MGDIVTVNVTEVVESVTVNVTEVVEKVDVNVTYIGMPVGGDIGQVLKKKSSKSFDTVWQGGGVDSINGQSGVIEMPVVLFGTGLPPSPSGLLDGTQFLKYTP